MILTLKNVPLFHDLSEEELESVKKCLHEKEYQKGEILLSEGAACERIFIVREGRVKLYRTAASGREQILETLEKGETCACNPGAAQWSCATSAEAITPCKVWFLSRSDYVRMVQTNAKLAHALNLLFAERLQCLNALVEEVALKDVKKRLIKFLLDMLTESLKKPGKSNALFIPFTREEIAQRLGAARETVARYLTQLKDAHLIEIKPYQIVILDKKGLEELLR